MLKLSFDFHFVCMVFLAMVSTVRRTVVFPFVIFIPDVSPSKQSEGDSGLENEIFL